MILLIRNHQSSSSLNLLNDWNDEIYSKKRQFIHDEKFKQSQVRLTITQSQIRGLLYSISVNYKKWILNK